MLNGMVRGLEKSFQTFDRLKKSIAGDNIYINKGLHEGKAIGHLGVYPWIRNGI